MRVIIIGEGNEGMELENEIMWLGYKLWIVVVEENVIEICYFVFDVVMEVDWW